jgi:hypothetical protein
MCVCVAFIDAVKERRRCFSFLEIIKIRNAIITGASNYHSSMIWISFDLRCFFNTLMTDPSSTCRRWKFDSNIFPFFGGEGKLFGPGRKKKLKSPGVLNGDCKSHWLTNEEIKDGRKEIPRDGRFLRFCRSTFSDTISRVCVCLYRKIVLFSNDSANKNNPFQSAGWKEP